MAVKIGNKQFTTEYPEYKVSVRVFQGLTQEEMSGILTHERIHLEHELAIKESREKIAAENKAKNTMWNNMKGTGLKDEGITVEQEKERVSAEMKAKFGADVSQTADTEALAYSQAFAETYKQNKDVALHLLLEIQEPAKGLTFYSASIEAQDIAIKHILGVASTKTELQDLRKRFTTVFKDKRDPKFVDQVVKAIDAKISELGKRK